MNTKVSLIKQKSDYIHNYKINSLYKKYSSLGRSLDRIYKNKSLEWLNKSNKTKKIRIDKEESDEEKIILILNKHVQKKKNKEFKEKLTEIQRKCNYNSHDKIRLCKENLNQQEKESFIKKQNKRHCNKEKINDEKMVIEKNECVDGFKYNPNYDLKFNRGRVAYLPPLRLKFKKNPMELISNSISKASIDNNMNGKSNSIISQSLLMNDHAKFKVEDVYFKVKDNSLKSNNYSYIDKNDNEVNQKNEKNLRKNIGKIKFEQKMKKQMKNKINYIDIKINDSQLKINYLKKEEMIFNKGRVIIDFNKMRRHGDLNKSYMNPEHAYYNPNFSLIERRNKYFLFKKQELKGIVKKKFEVEKYIHGYKVIDKYISLKVD